MIIEIRAFRKDGSEILGSLDGQALYECKNYKMTDHYKTLKTRKTLNVSCWKVYSKPSFFSKELTFLENIETQTIEKLFK